MSDQDAPRPADPEEVGIPERRPPFSRTEGAHVLASKAREPLEPSGFTEQQILEWAEVFIDEEGSGDVDAFVAWIRDREEEAEGA